MTDDNKTEAEAEIVAPDEVNPNAFTEWLEQFPYGMLGSDLSGALAECSTATRELERKSSFVMTVTLAPGKSGMGEISVATDVKSNPARPKTPVFDFFPVDGGSLSRDDPNQPPMPGMERPEK